LIYIGKLATSDDELVDLERVDSLHGILPASLFDRSFVFYFVLGLLEVEKQLRVIYFEVRHHVAGEQSPPVNACGKIRYFGDGRFGIGILGNDRVFEIKTKSDWMKIELAYPYGIAFQRRVDLGFRPAPQGLIDEEGRDHQ
jgi:hypothetical protein